MVEFEENDAMKPKVYPLDCKVGSNHWRPFIVISYEYTFSASDRV